ncbi:type VI secretion system protein TssA [Alteromonas sp. ASW11-130]|uniref:type VI secretion system protein TssA n=1 Tax=Alteromonas sp. ASW11-130 TaxID=3015775 RepID=UPI002242A9E6|nr:type VI secretion system protein TssA [Alteromonas sp. ASW11-130]MCW8092781.1 type VI secretion system protein TssA [Alteromonas sp. ASW11-130]
MDAALDELLRPVGDEPAGCDPQSIESYERLVDVINSLDGLNKVSIDWHTVIDTSYEILTKFSKDLRTANYLTYAWFINHQFQGLSNGFRLLNGLVTSDYSDNLFPIRKKRQEKARAAPFAWLSTKLDKHFALKTYEGPSDLLYADEAFENFQLLNQKLNEYLVRETPLSPELNESLKRFAEEAKRVKEAHAEKEAAAQAKKDVPSQEINTSETVQPTATHSPVTATHPQDITSSEDVTKVLNAVCKSLNHVADFVHRQSTGNAEFYYFNRLAKWILVTELPEKGVLPQQPSQESISNLDSLEQNANHLELLNLAEELFQKGAIFYLDLHRQVFNALKATNQNAAAEVVLSTTRNFVSRFPNIIHLTFSNDTPFVGPKTLLWLESSSTKAEEQTTKERTQAENNKWKNAIDEANTMLVEGKTVDAIKLIEGLSGDAECMRDLAYWRFELAKILFKTGYIDMALLNLETLKKELQQHKVDVWEPVFYKEVLKLNLDAHSTMSAKQNYDNEMLNEIRGLKRELINISPSDAIQYSEFGK